MAKRMLIDATHPEETRVAVVNGTRLEEYDYETLVRKQLKGNIYLVKVTRVEPSLQAAFVDFGGNRHGFLPFPEIHPDYYRIPIADREALIAEERALAAAQAAQEDAEDEAELAAAGETLDADDIAPAEGDDAPEIADAPEEAHDGDYEPRHTGSLAAAIEQDSIESGDEEDPAGEESGEGEGEGVAEAHTHEEKEEDPDLDTVGGDVVDAPVFRSSIKRRYKIQEVIKRNQIMLIQISKEERGNKGAAVTSYISLPGRYCVLMPNSPRGGGVSRKVSNAKDRQRLKHVLKELNVPEGMSVILRTAGVARSTAEIKRDLDYLLRLWDQIRELTLKSTAPALIYEEGNLTKRAIRDLYRREIDEVLVAGDEGYSNACDFMRTLMPSHVEKVVQYKEEHVPLFTRYQVESQIDAIHNPTVHLKSGGYIVINPTEAMVSIDVNSGRATKGRHIEETALKTNLEAAEEIARQLRLRDQGGLIVIDFIDMEDKRGNRIVEKRLRDAMQNDRARIQLGRISAFGLLELSRQRLHPSLVETNFETCKHCNGTGLTRTIETSGVMVLRAIEEEGLKGRAAEIKVTVPPEVALYIFNNKRDMLSAIEKRHGIRVFINADDSLIKPAYKIDMLRASGAPSSSRPQKPAPVQGVDLSDLSEFPDDPSDEGFSGEEESHISTVDDHGGDGDHRGRRRRRGRDRDRGGRGDRGDRGGRERGGRDRNFDRGPRRDAAPRPEGAENAAPQETTQGGEPREGGFDGAEGSGGADDRNGRRRGRRGGRRRGGRNRDRGPREAGDAHRVPGSGDQPVISEHPSFDKPAREAPAPREESNFRHRDRGADSAHAREAAVVNGDSGGPSDDDAPSGNRKGWWKRLTE